MNRDMSCNHYRIGHVSINVGSREDILLDLVNDLLSIYSSQPDSECQAAITVSLEFLSNPGVFSLLGDYGTGFIFETERAEYYSYSNLWYIRYKDIGFMIVDRKMGKISGYVNRSCLDSDSWDLEFFLHPLFELLRQHRLYQYHSAAVSSCGKGLLISGISGAGKSTLSLDLLDNGFLHLSDDRCFLHKTSDDIEIIAFPEPAKAYINNIRHINVVKHIETDITDSKILLPLDELYPGMQMFNCRLSGIIFPKWAPESKSRLEKVSPGFVLKNLLPLSMVCFEQDTSKAHFDFNCRLAETIPAVQLVMGDDRNSWYKLAYNFLLEIQ